jgi:hypothetical protein
MVDKPGRSTRPIRGDRVEGVWFSCAPRRRQADELVTGPRVGAGGHRPARAAGQTVALVGETGAGRSTLAKLVARFMTRSGVGCWSTDTTRKLRAQALRSQLGIVPRGIPVLGHDRDNIAFGRPDASDEDIAAAAPSAPTCSSTGFRPARHRGRRARRGPLGRTAADRRLRALLAEPRI